MLGRLTAHSSGTPFSFLSSGSVHAARRLALPVIASVFALIGLHRLGPLGADAWRPPSPTATVSSPTTSSPIFSAAPCAPACVPRATSPPSIPFPSHCAASRNATSPPVPATTAAPKSSVTNSTRRRHPRPRSPRQLRRRRNSRRIPSPRRQTHHIARRHASHLLANRSQSEAGGADYQAYSSSPSTRNPESFPSFAASKHRI